ncbi:TraR/DksA C4-type zinc finger protein [Acinetobacter puyangensis]|uniref:TraR/DksA C4-type zinc finger protein n=1 Tax=Acinetobacter puyangensis TaxID=1096779 RepID=UPI003A4D9D3C
MADIADVAADVIEQNLAHTLQNIRRTETPSLFECSECGEEIPEQRRKHGGITLCIGCQTELEAKQKHRRG